MGRAHGTAHAIAGPLRSVTAADLAATVPDVPTPPSRLSLADVPTQPMDEFEALLGVKGTSTQADDELRRAQLLDPDRLLSMVPLERKALYTEFVRVIFIERLTLTAGQLSEELFRRGVTTSSLGVAGKGAAIPEEQLRMELKEFGYRMQLSVMFDAGGTDRPKGFRPPGNWKEAERVTKSERERAAKPRANAEVFRTRGRQVLESGDWLLFVPPAERTPGRVKVLNTIVAALGSYERPVSDSDLATACDAARLSTADWSLTASEDQVGVPIRDSAMRKVRGTLRREYGLPIGGNASTGLWLCAPDDIEESAKLQERIAKATEWSAKSFDEAARLQWPQCEADRKERDAVLAAPPEAREWSDEWKRRTGAKAAATKAANERRKERRDNVRRRELADTKERARARVEELGGHEAILQRLRNKSAHYGSDEAYRASTPRHIQLRDDEGAEALGFVESNRPVKGNWAWAPEAKSPAELARKAARKAARHRDGLASGGGRYRKPKRRYH